MHVLPMMMFPLRLGTGCWRVVELELVVNPTPIVPIDLEPIIACDPDMDGFEVFDLTQRAADDLRYPGC